MLSEEILGIALEQEIVYLLSFLCYSQDQHISSAQASDLIRQALRSQVLKQPDDIARKNSYKLETTQTNFPGRTWTLVFTLRNEVD